MSREPLVIQESTRSTQTRVSSRSTKGPVRFADEHNYDSRRYHEGLVPMPGQFVALPKYMGNLHAHQIKIPYCYTIAIKSPQTNAW